MLALFLIKNFFLISKIEVVTDYEIKKDGQIYKILKKAKQENIWRLDVRKVSEMIKSQDIKIKEVEIKKEFLNKITIKIIQRKPLLQIFFEQKYFLIDQEGILFSVNDQNQNLPFLEMNLEKTAVGVKIKEEKALTILSILEELEKTETIGKVLISEKKAEILFRDNLLIFLPQENLLSKIASLQELLNRFRIEGKRPVSIDLRFEKPVVVF